MKKISKAKILQIAGAVILVLRLLGVSVDAPYVNQVAEAVCAVLIILGIVIAPKTDDDDDNDINGGGSVGD